MRVAKQKETKEIEKDIYCSSSGTSDGKFQNPLIKNPLVRAVAWPTNKQGPC
jgi:hypothetical protein